MNDIAQAFLNLPGYEIKEILQQRPLVLRVEVARMGSCPHCEGSRLRRKAKRERRIRHWNMAQVAVWFVIESFKYVCLGCGRYFWQRFEGINPRSRMSEVFKQQVCREHHRGVTAVDIHRDYRIGHATVSRWYEKFLFLRNQMLKERACPRVMGIDEHFFTRKLGYMTTICDLGKHKVFDVVLGRSEASLERYLRRLPGKDNVQVIVMDLSSTYRAIAKKYFPNAKIVADRFHVIRLVNQHFLNTWKILDPVGRSDRGLLSLMRRHQHRLEPTQKQNLRNYLRQHPALEAIYDFKRNLTGLLLHKSQTARHCRRLIPQLLQMIQRLKREALEPLATLGKTLNNWIEEIVCMWRFTKSNGITEGFHNKMEMISRRAYGFRNFNNFRMKVKVMCA